MNATDVKYIVIHCSAHPPRTKADIKDITRDHLMRNFRTVGYHYVITRAGIRQKGRPENEAGAHEPKVNRCSVAVCLIGGVRDDNIKVPEDNFTAEQYHELALLVKDLKSRYPKAEVLGHRDIPGVKKACPSFDVRAWYAETVAPHLQ